MEISSFYYPKVGLTNVKFKGNEETKSYQEQKNKIKNNAQIPDFNPVVQDFNIKTPIKYNLVENIELPNELRGKYYKLTNGQKIIIVPKKGPTVVKTYVNTGSMNEPDHLRGISHFIEHNLFNGSETLGDKVFFEEVNKLGANTNASTSFSLTDYYIESGLLEKGDLEKEIQLHAGMLQSPKFLAEKIEKEKDIVNSEINMYMSNDESVGYSNTIKNLFNIKTSSNDLVAGTTDNITNVTRDDVVNYFNENYYPANMVTVITGDVNEKETIDLVSKYFNSTKTPQKPRHYEKFEPIEKSVRNDFISKKTTTGAASIFIGFAGPKNNDYNESIKIDALEILLSGLNKSRFSELERDKNINIGILEERIGTRPTDNELIMIATEVEEGDSEKVLHKIYDIVNNLEKNPPNEFEMTAIKNHLKKVYSDIFETSQGINYALAEAYIDGNGEILKNYNERIDSLTSSDIVETAKKYLNLNKASITVVHPSVATKESIMNNFNAEKISNQKAALQRIDTSKITQYTLNNNINVVFNDTNTDNIQYHLKIENRKTENKTPGITDMLSLILEDCGTQNISSKDLDILYDKAGIDQAVIANTNEIISSGKFPKESLQTALELMQTRIMSPAISEKNVNSLKANIIKGYLTTDINPYEEYLKEMFPKNCEKATTVEKAENIVAMKSEDVQKYYNDIINNGQMTITLSGPFSKHPELKNEVIAFLENKMPKMQPFSTDLKNNFEPIKKTKVLTKESMKNQAQILEGFKFKQNGNVKDHVSLALLNQILGGSASSRLFSDLREERHLAYSVGSALGQEEDEGLLTLRIKTTTQNAETGENTFDNIKKSIDGFNENIEKLLKEGITQEELDFAKKNYKAKLMSVEKNSTKNSIIQHSMHTPYGLNYENERMKAIEDITVEDINNTIQHIFNSKPIYSITATKETLAQNKEFLDSLIN